MGGKYDGVRAASKSSIEIDFYYHGKRCRERIKLKPTATNLKRAERHRAAILDAIYSGTFDYNTTFPNSKNKPTSTRITAQEHLLAFHLANWLRNIKKHIAASTFDDYRKTVNNILIPEFGDIAIQDFRKSHVKDWGKDKTCSNKRFSNILSPLRSVLDEAVDNEILEVNPLAGWQYTHKEPPKKSKIDPFSQKEMQAIFAATTGQGKNVLQFLFWTGLRTSEMVALNWEDVDLVNDLILINKAMTKKTKTPEKTKTESGNREIKLLPPAKQALIAQKQHTYLKNEEVFQNPRHLERWTGDQAIRKTLWTPALKKAGVRYRNPYQTRHTYASMMLSAGESPMWVKTQMGHSDLKMIFQTYGKWIPDADPDAGSKAVKIFTQKS
jgi:integrase